ncbi:hypothetical protein [Streptomyces sp. NPDC102487]|uniref:hypothetical protein n=1 Tax=Streptomyces sp. NPDC102487 TaxID=3366182 RepID=UPI003829A694
MREDNAHGAAEQPIPAAEQPIPRDRPDQQATDGSDPLDIETMLGHARRREEDPPPATENWQH